MHNELPNYELLRELGSGCFGVVYLARDRRTGRHVALKRVEKVGELVSREWEILDRLKSSQNCIQLLDFFYSRNERGQLTQNMVFEFMPSNLEEVLVRHNRAKRRIPEPMVKSLMLQVLNGLREMHEKDVAHRDIKPENVLMQGQKVRLADFGSSKVLTEGHFSTPYIVSRFYRAPELLLCVTEYTEKIDLWAAGCVLAELALGEPAFKGADDGDQIFAILKIMGGLAKGELTYFIQKSKFKSETLKKFPKFKRDRKVIEGWFGHFEDAKDAIDLVTGLLEIIPEKRMSAAEAIQHSFFDSVRDQLKSGGELF